MLLFSFIIFGCREKERVLAIESTNFGFGRFSPHTSYIGLKYLLLLQSRSALGLGARKKRGDKDDYDDEK